MNNQEWKTSKEAKLNKTQLKEGSIYSLPFLSKNGIILVNECLYAVFEGKIVIHRSANWEDISRSNLTKEAFLNEEDLTISKIPEDLTCFIELKEGL